VGHKADLAYAQILPQALVVMTKNALSFDGSAELAAELMQGESGIVEPERESGISASLRSEKTCAGERN